MTIFDTIFSKPNLFDASKALAKSSVKRNIEGCSDLDFIDWWKPLLAQKYNMSILMMIIMPNLLNKRQEDIFKDIIDRMILLSNSHRYRHSELSVTYRYSEEAHYRYEKEKPFGSYLNWFVKRPVNYEYVSAIQFSIAFRRKEISFVKFLDFIITFHAIAYNIPEFYDNIRLRFYRDDKIPQTVNKVWTSVNFNDIAKNMYFYRKYPDKDKRRELQKDLKSRLKVHRYRTKNIEIYETDGIQEWFEKYSSNNRKRI